MRFITAFKFLFAALAAAAPAHASVVALNNLPGTGTYNQFRTLSTSAWEAAGMTTDTHQEQFISMQCELNGAGSGGIAEGGIYSDNAGVPGSLLAAFNNVTVPSGGIFLETLNTATTTILQPSTKYWFVLHDVVAFSWAADSATNGTVPTTAAGFTYNGFRTSTNTGGIWTTDANNNTVTITTTAVPEPGTLLLAAIGAAGLLSIALRRMR